MPACRIGLIHTARLRTKWTIRRRKRRTRCRPLRAERARRTGHHMLGHLRTEAYPVYRRPGYPAARGAPDTVADVEARIAEGKRRAGS